MVVPQTVCVQECGNGIQDPTEACDDGNQRDHDACLNNCEAARCGDGIHRVELMEDAEGYEQCDDGNEELRDACLNDCTVARCGDGHHRLDLQPGEEGFEACDDA